MSKHKDWARCQAGHDKHATLLIPTRLGNLWIYDAAQYMGFNGYCTGQDDISRTIQNTGVWEPEETALVEELLAEEEGGFVMDIGAHIGWYSILAARMGYDVLAVEANAENITLMQSNAYGQGVSDRITIKHEWIQEGSKLRAPLFVKDIDLVIIDIEGNEQYAVEALAKYFEKQQIKHALIEISPCFNNSYPALVKRMFDWGYTARLEGKRWNGVLDFYQANILFSRPEK